MRLPDFPKPNRAAYLANLLAQTVCEELEHDSKRYAGAARADEQSWRESLLAQVTA